jgi:hypothetical protein
MGKSEFNGGVGGFIGNLILMSIISIIPFVGFAIGYEKFLKWFFSHTVIDGAQMRYDGKWGKICKKVWIWAILTCITIGIYGFWVPKKAAALILEDVHVEGQA